ncbi:biotin-dependent carboxyltransferase family protein [Dokdonella sp.]|uniref:5-oxoprolinase subunit C family protein n=1 Tax=Dokdonella sp. TaxID=2291710 RepID=UPI003785045A
MSVRVLKPGLLTTIQDGGRRGCAASGIGSAGAMDEVALRLANALAGNPPDAAALEFSLLGPVLQFERAATVALCGAVVDARIDGNAVSGWKALHVGAGSTLDCSRMPHGAYASLAFAGGISVPRVLGSASSDVNAGLGPRALRSGDHIELDAPNPPAGASRRRGPAWTLDPRPWFDADRDRPIRLVRGSHFDALDDASRSALFEQAFRVSAESNRVGTRLDGPRLALHSPLELVSEAVAHGTLQLPPGGQPIALMAEHPTTGGYPRIGQIAAIDLPRLAQRRPGDAVRLEEIGIDEAQTRYLQRERELARLCESIAMRLAR